MLENYDDLMTFKEYRKALGIGKNKAYELLIKNKIKHFRIGNEYRIPKKFIIEFIESKIKEKNIN